MHTTLILSFGQSVTQVHVTGRTTMDGLEEIFDVWEVRGMALLFFLQ